MSGGKEIVVLEDINIKVMEGEFVSILGPSGAGKSTLLRIMAGLAMPSAGDIFYNGMPLKSVKPKIGMVFQSFALFPWLSVVENAELGLKSYGLSDEEARRRGTQKTVLERRAPPTFDVLIEIQHRERFAVHLDIMSAVDSLLRDAPILPEIRTRDESGEIKIEKATQPKVRGEATKAPPRTRRQPVSAPDRKSVV